MKTHSDLRRAPLDRAERILRACRSRPSGRARICPSSGAFPAAPSPWARSSLWRSSVSSFSGRAAHRRRRPSPSCPRRPRRASSEEPRPPRFATRRLHRAPRPPPRAPTRSRLAVRRSEPFAMQPLPAIATITTPRRPRARRRGATIRICGRARLVQRSARWRSPLLVAESLRRHRRGCRPAPARMGGASTPVTPAARVAHPSSMRIRGARRRCSRRSGRAPRPPRARARPPRAGPRDRPRPCP